jgi:hypothetical protein
VRYSLDGVTPYRAMKAGDEVWWGMHGWMVLFQDDIQGFNGGQGWETLR